MITQSVCQNGTFITWQFPVSRIDAGGLQNYSVVLNEPAGVTYVGVVFSKVGPTYAPGLMNMGAMTGLETIQVVLTYQVTDLNLAILDIVDNKKYFNFKAEVFGPDQLTTNNIREERVQVSFCPPSGAIVDQEVACCAVDLKEGGTPCSSCTNEYRMVMGSEVNGVVIGLNPVTGTFFWQRDNPTQEGSVQFTLWCINCADGNSYQVSGPATITFLPLFLNYVAGPQGEQGVQGAQGFQGAQGLQGLQGLQGAQGAQGLQGFQGSQGGVGTQGVQGSQGSTGVQGSQGIQGAAGPQGSQGSQGNQGVTGAQGLQGFQGATGAQGSQGATGTQGAQGNDGAAINILGSVAAFGNLPGGASVGDAYLVLSNNHVWVWDGAAWVDLGLIQGPQGSQGSQGSQGTQGVQGAQGVIGTQGVQGSQGFQGTQGNQGFQGLQGSQGFQGVQGNTGFQGNQGTQGLQGNQGFQGFQGLQGSQGSQGSQGLQGLQGLQGVQGSQGDQGNQGFQGLTGVQGAQGAQAAAGAQGSQGATGTQGFQGVAGTGAQGSQGAVGSQGSQGSQGITGSFNTAQTINAQTGTSYTLVLLDAGKLVTMDNTLAQTLAVPTDASVAFPIGTVIKVAELNTGILTISGTVGVTILTYSGSIAGGQYAVTELQKIATDTWLLYGDLTV